MEYDWPEASGTLVYDPRGSRPRTLILQVSEDWTRYARWLIRGREPRRWMHVVDPEFNRGGKVRHVKPGLVGGVIMPPDWGCHITIIRGERIHANHHDWGRFERGEEIFFEFDPDPWYNDRHVWFDVECGFLTAIREHFGLRERSTRVHLQAGSWDEFTPGIGDNSRRKFWWMDPRWRKFEPHRSR